MLMFSDLKRVSLLFFITSIFIYALGKFEALNLNIEPNLTTYYSFLIAVVSFCYIVAGKYECTLKANVIKVHFIFTFLFIVILFLINNFFNSDNEGLAFLDIILFIMAFIFQFVFAVLINLK
jgi:hypothetical protein